MPDHDTVQFGANGFTWRGRFFPYIAGGDGTDGDGNQDDTNDQGDGGSDSQADDLAGLKSALEKERKANRENARLLKELQKFKQDAEDAQLGEADRLKKQAEEASASTRQLQDELRIERTERAMERAATAANIPLEVAQSMIKVEYDDEGKISTDLQAAAKALAQKYPGLVIAAVSSGNPTNPDRGRTGSTGTGDLSSALAAHYNR